MDSNKERDFLAQLLPIIAVQLRSALGNIHFAASALAPTEKREKDPELDSKAAVLDQSYYQLLRLIDNLTVAGYLQHDNRLPAKDQDLVATVRKVYEESASLAKLLDLNFAFHCDMDSHMCAGYRDSIEQLLFQLLSNSFKFTPKGGSVTIELKASGGLVFLSVTDTGIGISEELLPTLFDRYRHDDLLNPPPHGLGLGLPLCRRIAEGLDGSIMAESKPGKGTRITLSIPDRQTGIPSVSDVPFDYAGGFNRTLLSLADALPVNAFRLNNLN